MERDLALNSKESAEARDRIWYGYFEYLRSRVQRSLRCSFSLDEIEETVPASWIYPYLDLPGFTHVARKQSFESLQEYKRLCTPDAETSSASVQICEEEITSRLIKYRLEIIDGYEEYKVKGVIGWRMPQILTDLPAVTLVDTSLKSLSTEERIYVTPHEIEIETLTQIFGSPVPLPLLVKVSNRITIPVMLRKKIRCEVERRILLTLPDESFPIVIYSACPNIRLILSYELHAAETKTCEYWRQYPRIVITENWKLLKLGLRKVVIIRTRNYTTTDKCSYLLNRERMKSKDPWFSDKMNGLGQFDGVEVIQTSRGVDCLPVLKLALEP